MIRFYSKRYIYFGISLAILLAGAIAIAINGVVLDIQFKGGSIIKYTFEGTIDTEKVDQVVKDATNGREANSKITTDIATKTQNLAIELTGKKGLSSTAQEKLNTALKDEFKTNNLKWSESNIVEPFIGKEYWTKAKWAIFLSFLLIILYVGFRFRKIGGVSASVMALVALVHDVLVAFTIFVVLKMPINDNFIAVALTIIGFSVNDTIVIYDRIRENARTMKAGTPIEDLVDKSITQSMTRSINTSLATFFSIAIVYIFAHFYGISSIKSFALPMMFGIISGSYSTICIAGPLWVMWKKFREKSAVKAKA